MKAAAVRRLANERSADELAHAIEALVDAEQDELGVEGDDLGEKLTHLMLAQRVRARIDAGEDPTVAFRSEMASVRTVLTNEG